MDKDLLEKGKKLEMLEADDAIESHRVSIAEKKAVESKLKKEYGTLAKAKQILGFIHIDRSTLHTLYSQDPSLREANNPKYLRRHR